VRQGARESEGGKRRKARKTVKNLPKCASCGANLTLLLRTHPRARFYPASPHLRTHQARTRPTAGGDKWRPTRRLAAPDRVATLHLRTRPASNARPNLFTAHQVGGVGERGCGHYVRTTCGEIKGLPGPARGQTWMRSSSHPFSSHHSYPHSCRHPVRRSSPTSPYLRINFQGTRPYRVRLQWGAATTRRPPLIITAGPVPAFNRTRAARRSTSLRLMARTWGVVGLVGRLRSSKALRAAAAARRPLTTSRGKEEGCGLSGGGGAYKRRVASHAGGIKCGGVCARGAMVWGRKARV